MYTNILNCQYYQYLTSISYPINTTSQQFRCTSNFCKAVTSHCSNIQTHCSEIESHCSDKQTCYSSKYQKLGLPSPSQLVAAKTILATASALCLNQTKHEIPNSTYRSQFELSLCSENSTRYGEYSQHQGLTNPSLLVAVRFTLTAMSVPYLKYPKHVFQSIHYDSLIIPTRCSEIQSHCSECSYLLHNSINN